MRVGSRGVERAGLTQSQIAVAQAAFEIDPRYGPKSSFPDHLYRAQRQRPLLMLHFLDDSDRPRSSAQVPVCAMGLSFPILTQATEMVSYRVNLVEIRNMMEADIQQGDDEEETEAADVIA